MFKKMLGKIFGNKQDRDVATYTPVVVEINEVFAGLSGLTNDQLRNRTHTLRARIAEHLSEIDASIASLKEAAKGTARQRARSST
jgi:preprotein translocase subunit SecA